MISESELEEKYRVKKIDKLKPAFQCLICGHIWTPEKSSDGKMPCEYWYCPNYCTDWRWLSSGNKWILKDSSPFVFEVPFEIKSSGICKDRMKQKIRKEIGDKIYKNNVEKLKELNKEFLFSWTEGQPKSDIFISETDKIRIKNLLDEDVEVNWIENAIIKGDKKKITLINRNDQENVLSFVHEKDSKVFLKVKNRDYKNSKKVLKFVMEMENDRRKIYKLSKFDLGLHLEISTHRLNYQDVDNIQKTVLDALKGYLFDDDPQIFRVLCWKTKKQENDKYNMAALTISFRIHDSEKQMCMVKLDKLSGESGLIGC